MFQGGGTEDPDKIPAQTTLSDVCTQVTQGREEKTLHQAQQHCLVKCRTLLAFMFEK